jgi:hypothetical protein
VQTTVQQVRAAVLAHANGLPGGRFVFLPSKIIIVSGNGQKRTTGKLQRGTLGPAGHLCTKNLSLCTPDEILSGEILALCTPAFFACTDLPIGNILTLQTLEP